MMRPTDATGGPSASCLGMEPARRGRRLGLFQSAHLLSADHRPWPNPERRLWPRRAASRPGCADLNGPRRNGYAARRGAALYLTTLSISVLAATMGLGLIASQRADRRLQGNMSAENEVWWCARAGIEMAMTYMENVADWRQRVSNNVLFSDVPAGDGTCTVFVYGADGGSVAGQETLPVRIVSMANGGGAAYRLEARLLPRTHPALSFTVFGTSSQDMEFRGNVVVRGPVRSHGRIRSDSGVKMEDDASFTTLDGYNIENPLNPKIFASTPIPAPDLDFNTYLAMATPISGTYGAICKLEGYNLTPTHNPTGVPNPNGIYALDAGGREVLVENVHIEGTLIIKNTGGKPVTFGKAAWIEPGPMNYPVLLVDTTNDLNLSLDQPTLSESETMLVIGIGGENVTIGTGVDFNEDGDTLDSFPTSVRGIVYSTASRVRLDSGAWPFTGSIINRRIRVNDDVVLDNDFQLLNALCPGLVTPGMQLLSGSFREVP